MSRSHRRRGLWVGAAAFALAAAFWGLGLGRGLELKSWDARMKLFASPGRADKDIVLVLVDQYSLDFFKKQNVSWPWPRQVYAPLAGFFGRGGARAVFFDIVMTEPSAYGVEDDEMLAAAIAEAGNVILPVALSREEREESGGAEDFLRRFASMGAGLRPFSGKFQSATVPIAPLRRAARGGANVSAEPDGDGVFRRLPLLYDLRGTRIPSVTLALAETARRSGVSSGVPLDRDGRMLIRFFGPALTYRSYPAAAIINSWLQLSEGKTPQIPPSEFSGKIVLVGLSAVGLFDMKTTPLAAAVAGVEIQAAALDTLLNRRFLRTVPAAADLVLALLLAAFAAVALSSVKKTGTTVAAAAGFLALPPLLGLSAFAVGWGSRIVLPEIAVLLAIIGAAVLNYAVEGRERRFLKSAFRYYLSPAVIDRVIADPGLLRLGGERREITSFFSDVAGFTSVSEALGPEALVALLNEYLSAMTDILLDAGGTLDKYEGDAIVAFWNAPLPTPDHAWTACRAALACQARLAQMAPDFEKKFGRSLRVRIGLNTGPAVVGNMGSSRRFDYTAMGDTVNLAARLEGACKPFGISILAGEGTVAAAGGRIAAREVDVLRVVGKSQPVRIFEIVGEAGAVPQPVLARLAKFEDVLAAYRRRAWDEALAACRSIPEDPVAAAYAARCRKFIEEPPPADWDLVFDLQTK